MSAKLPIWAILSSVFFQKAHTQATGKPPSRRRERRWMVGIYPAVMVAPLRFRSTRERGRSGPIPAETSVSHGIVPAHQYRKCTPIANRRDGHLDRKIKAFRNARQLS